MTAGQLGCILTPGQGNLIPARAELCADNGAFGAGYVGDERWFAWLSTLPLDRVRFAVAPDVPFDAAATLDRSRPWLPRIRELGVAAALAGQDGLEDLDVPWAEFDVLFIGGTTGWKLGPAAAELTYAAHQRGKGVHMGRVNSAKRMRYARHIGCDSVDGTYLTYGPDVNLPAVLAWLHESNDQGVLL
jgi:hypothetical protein